jgi:hypothetical protein
MQARHLTIVHYPPEQLWTCVEINSPEWEDVSVAIRRMDDDEYPIVQLSWKEVGSCFDDEESFNVIGGAVSGFALFEFIPGWNFEDPFGSNEDIRLWQSDQGYFCKRKNVIVEVDKVLELARIYFETGSYEALQTECLKRGKDMSRP